ncbi:MAG: SPFH domain-containing protein, partial [Candidatus Paceibacterota bacterium]
MDMPNISLELVILFVSVLAALLKGLGFVKEGERGIKLRFGKAQKDKRGELLIREPGLVFLFPFMDTLEKRHVRQQTINLVDQRVWSKEGFMFTAGGVLIYKIKDIYKALFAIGDFDSSVSNMAMVIFYTVLSSKSLEELKNEDGLNEELVKSLSEAVEDWGVEVIKFGRTDLSPSPEITHIVSMKESMILKLAALQEAASQMDMELKDMPSGLAAALVGIPVTSNVGSRDTIRW